MRYDKLQVSNIFKFPIENRRMLPADGKQLENVCVMYCSEKMVLA